MALNNTTFFTVVGKYIKTVNVFDGLLTTIQTGSDDIEGVLETNNLTRLFAEIPGLFTGYQNNVVGWIEATNGLVSEVITDRDFVREQIPVQGDSLNSILLALIEYMNDEADHVTASVVTIGSVTDNVTSTTIGDLIVNKMLDGVSAPMSDGLPSREYRGLDSQLSVPDDTIYAQCTQKNDDGQEVWQLFSSAPSTGAFQVQDEAAGAGPILRTANSDAGGLGVSNGSLETYTTTDVPDGWTMTGTVTTDYLENNTASRVFRGSSSLQINTTATALKQQIFNATYNKLYMLSVQVARDDTDPGGSTMDVVLSVENSDGSVVYFTSTTEIAKPAGSSDIFVPAYLHWYLDDQYDNQDVYIKILVNNFVSSPTSLWLDEVLINAPVYYNGVNFSILRGVTEFSLGDRFAVDVDNDEAGVIQNYFRKAYRIQLPTDGTPSIADNLAT